MWGYSLPAGAGEVVGLASGLAVLQAEHLGIVRLDLADLVHELQLVHPGCTQAAYYNMVALSFKFNFSLNNNLTRL